MKTDFLRFLDPRYWLWKAKRKLRNYDWFLRFQKSYFLFLYRYIYPEIPFEMAQTEIAPDGVYSDYPPHMNSVLAEFDAGGKHWIIFN